MCIKKSLSSCRVYLLIKNIKREAEKEEARGWRGGRMCHRLCCPPHLLVGVEGVAPPPSTLAKGGCGGGATLLFSTFLFLFCVFYYLFTRISDMMTWLLIHVAQFYWPYVEKMSAGASIIKNLID